MKPLKIALIGAGRRGRGAHLPVILKLTDIYELVAVCDKDQATAAEIAEQYGLNAYNSVRDLVAREELDAADMVVPGSAHHAIGAFLANEGIHYLVETPIAPTRPLTDLMIDEAKRNGIKLEVAENYYRAPIERFYSAVIDAGWIGNVTKIYRIFQEGGYHGMSLLRLRAGADPRSILGVAHTSPVVPHTDRLKRHHTQEKWAMSVLDFQNDVLAVMAYSNVIHAKTLGRKQSTIWQIDGTKGAIVDGTLFLTAEEDLETGAIAQSFDPQRVKIQKDGIEVVEHIELEGPEGKIVWDNPFKNYALTESQVAIADELNSLAQAIFEDREPEYGAAAGRLDQEMSLAQQLSGKLDRQTVSFPLPAETEVENEVHDGFKDEFGSDPFEVDALLDVFYPRR